MRFRSLLNIPVLKFDKAIYSRLDLEADLIVLDLEDSIATADKAEARNHLRQALLHFKNPNIFVRINSDDHFFEDMAELRRLGVNSIVYPKFGPHHKLSAEDISCFRIFPVIETPQGLYFMYETLSTLNHLSGVIFGPQDLSASLGIEPCELNMTSYAQQVILVARMLNVPAYGYAGDFSHLSIEKLKENCHYARLLGFKGAPCIHPSHLAHINEIFSVEKPHIDPFTGIIAREGKMLGPPTLRRLENI